MGKRFYLIVAGVWLVLILLVLFVPGVAESIEGRMLSWLSRNAS